MYVDPLESTGLKKAMSTSYSLFSDLPLNLSVSSARSTDASLTSMSEQKLRVPRSKLESNMLENNYGVAKKKSNNSNSF